ncbi:hypothetical protein CN980_21290 [Bacillus cereus]|uniref:Uncharacterized protein n=1 Tax=Bacillus cereus TaxID=1396 RepID=A0A9X7C992_BACCE|nr:hypothetical protein CN980_21290 [Bacillus cereus]
MIENFLSLQHPFKIISRRIPFIIINDFHRQTKINRTFEENRTKNAIYLDYIQSIKSMIINTYIMGGVFYGWQKK